MKNNLIIFPNNKFILDNYNNIFIDDFCFDQINNNNLFSKYEVEQSILNSSEQIINSYQNINKIFYSILPQVKNELNRIHGLKYELPQWEIIIGPFLRKLIQQYYYKYNLVEHIFKKKKLIMLFYLLIKISVYHLFMTVTIYYIFQLIIIGMQFYGLKLLKMLLQILIILTLKLKIFKSKKNMIYFLKQDYLKILLILKKS